MPIDYVRKINPVESVNTLIFLKHQPTNAQV